MHKEGEARRQQVNIVVNVTLLPPYNGEVGEIANPPSILTSYSFKLVPLLDRFIIAMISS